MPGVCSRCLREVFFAEEKLALGKVWHTFCFSCRNCRKLLDSWTVATHSGELYCRNCHNRLFPTTSVRAALPFFVRATLPSVDNEDPVVSPCESLYDCRCCCYCSDDYAIINPREDEEQPVGSSDSPLGEKKRLRGGGGADGEEEELEKNSVQGTGGIDKSDCDIGDSQLDAQSFVTTLCDPPQGPTAVTAWYNRHHSASQSTFSRPSSALRQLNRPSSTPASAENGINRDAKGCRCARHRGPISPCRTNHKNRRHSESCHLHFRSEFHRPDKIVEPRERGKFVKDFAGGNFVENYRNHLRSRSPGGRSAGGGRCSANQGCQQPDGIDPCCQPKVPTGCECLGGGQDCQRCGRKVYQAEMQIASGVPYHNICFSCFCCRKPLETLTYHENCGEIYCKQCYVRNFGPQGYGYAGVLQTPM